MYLITGEVIVDVQENLTTQQTQSLTSWLQHETIIDLQSMEPHPNCRIYTAIYMDIVVDFSKSHKLIYLIRRMLRDIP